MQGTRDSRVRPGRRGQKILIGIAAAAAALVLAFFGLIGYGLRRLEAEDRIPTAYFPVSMAICEYCDARDAAPERLEDLVPEFLPALPLRRATDAVSYRKKGGVEKWSLGIAADVGRSRWIYYHSTDADLPPRAGKKLGSIHTWRVFEALETE